MNDQFKNLSENVNLIFNIFTRFNYKIYLVGGCVRDLLLGITPHDYDFATDATPEEIKEVAGRFNLLTNAAYVKTLPTGEKYGTITFDIHQGNVNELFEITTFRRDGNYVDGRRPDSVEFSTKLEDDLKRRDFTINALAYNPDEGIIDLFNGLSDLKTGIIRAINNPVDRFNEDALRILRCLRFSLKYNFTIDLATEAAAIQLVGNLKNVAKERIGKELFQILDYNLRCYSEDLLFHVFKYIFPPHEELSKFHLSTLNLLMSCKTKILRMYFLIKKYLDEDFTDQFDLTPEEIVELKSFAFDRSFTYEIINVSKALNYLNKYMTSSPHYLKGVFDFCITPPEKTALMDYVTFNSSYFSSDQLFVLTAALINKEPITVKDLNISGYDLLELGCRGAEISKVQKKLQEYVWRYPERNNRDELISYARGEVNGIY